MTRLTVWLDNEPAAPTLQTEDASEIARLLSGIGVKFERWAADRRLPSDANEATVLEAYRAEIDTLKRSSGYATADVIRLAKGTPDTAPLRAKFLDEHTHTEDEVRFFVEGSGAFYLHSGGKVYQVVCAANDLLSVPANTRHWFDMGGQPHFTAIRLFTNSAGWVANFTGDTIAKTFPLYAALS